MVSSWLSSIAGAVSLFSSAGATVDFASSVFLASEAGLPCSDCISFLYFSLILYFFSSSSITAECSFKSLVCCTFNFSNFAIDSFIFSRSCSYSCCSLVGTNTPLTNSFLPSKPFISALQSSLSLSSFWYSLSARACSSFIWATISLLVSIFALSSLFCSNSLSILLKSCSSSAFSNAPYRPSYFFSSSINCSLLPFNLSIDLLISCISKSFNFSSIFYHIPF